MYTASNDGMFLFQRALGLLAGSYAEGDDEDFTYECLGMEYPTLGATALLLTIFIFSIYMLTRACIARVTPSAAEKMQEAWSAADSAPVPEKPIANVPAESGQREMEAKL